LADNQEENSPEQALLILRAVIDGPLPGGPETRPDEVREVLADTVARLADLESKGGDFDRAVQSVNTALPWVPDTSYFRGHLFEVLGLVEERRALVLSNGGNPAGADQAKNRAIAAFEQSMTIQAEVIRTLSADAGKKK
jgi:hypothetical protein